MNVQTIVVACFGCVYDKMSAFTWVKVNSQVKSINLLCCFCNTEIRKPFELRRAIHCTFGRHFYKICYMGTGQFPHGQLPLGQLLPRIIAPGQSPTGKFPPRKTDPR